MEKLAVVGITKEPTYLYFLDTQLRVCSVLKKQYGGQNGLGRHVLHDAHLNRESGFLYFLDKQGDIARSPMNRSGGQKKARSGG
jgi:hypothetical protein